LYLAKPFQITLQ